MEISEYKKLLGNVRLNKKDFVKINWQPKRGIIKKYIQRLKTKIKSRYLVSRLRKKITHRTYKNPKQL